MGRRRTIGLAAVALVLASWGTRASGDEPPPPPPADRDFYVERIAAWLERNCAECHRKGGGAFRLTTPEAGQDEGARRRADFERVRAFVNPRAPWESRLLLKVLDRADGGDPHVGGSFVTADDEMHDTLLDFVSGATLDNLAPEVYLGEESIRAKPGETVILDGRNSYDRDREDMEKLTFWWELYAQPPGSEVQLPDRRASRFEFKPDKGGSYVFRLRVSDGKVWSAPRAVAVEVFQHVDVGEVEPGGVSALDKVDARALRRVRRLYLDLLGRSPTPAEAIAEERRGVKALVGTLSLRSEAGSAWYEELTARYGLLADFRPTGDEARALPLRIPSETLPPHTVERVLVRDPSFLRRHPAGRGLAYAIFELALDRPATAEELAAAVALARGETVEMPGLGTIENVGQWLDQVTRSPAFRAAATSRRLRRFLASGDAARRLPAAVAAAEAGGDAWRAQMEAVLLGTEYLERTSLRPKDDVTFVRALFFDLLERRPTDRELAALLHAVEQMPGTSAPMAALAKVMIDSGEVPIPLLVKIRDAPRWIRDRFLRYLGRRPTEAEMEAYGKALLHPGGGPELVIQALLTGPEYACR